MTSVDTLPPYRNGSARSPLAIGSGACGVGEGVEELYLNTKEHKTIWPTPYISRGCG